MGETREDIKERGVRRPQGWSESERVVALALRDERADPTSVCLDPDELLALIENGNDGEAAEGKIRHMITCAFCRHEYRQLRKALRLSEMLTSNDSAPSKTASVKTGSSDAAQGGNGSRPVRNFRTRPAHYRGVALAAALGLAAIIVLPSLFRGKLPAKPGPAASSSASIHKVPSSPQVMILVKGITRDPASDDLTVKCLLLNPNPTPAYQVRVTGADLGAVSANKSLKIDVGDIRAGGPSTVLTVVFPNAAGSSGERKKLTINGTASGQIFQAADVITLP